MPKNRPKSKTLKEAKKSISNLYGALQTEKAKHAKASDMVASMKHVIHIMENEISCKTNRISSLHDKLDEAKYNEQHASEVMANLIRKLN